MAYINKNVSTMAMPSGMNRMGQFPLDMSSVFYSESELKAYATSGAIAYVGQIISFNNNNRFIITLTFTLPLNIVFSFSINIIFCPF